MFGAIERRNPDAFRAGIGVSEGLAYRSARLCGIPLQLERLKAGRRLLYEVNFPANILFLKKASISRSMNMVRNLGKDDTA